MSGDLDSQIENLKGELKEWYIENEGPRDVNDYITELADSGTPCYYTDILDAAINDLSLATTVPELGAAFNGENTACNIIAANIFEKIEQELQEYFYDNKSEWDDEIDANNSEEEDSEEDEESESEIEESND
jgi:hypothetical protein